MAQRYVGLISGTSVDGVDAVLAEISAADFSILCAATRPYPAELQCRVAAIIERPEVPLSELGGLDAALGAFFAECALGVIASAGLEPGDIEAIGHHGQTVYHAPVPPEAFTMQIGDPNVVAASTGVTTVADFRRLDVALGGQGAPLVCAFHAWRFSAPAETRAIVNIGGIANITLLSPGSPVFGFDTGPGNTLLDRWIEREAAEPYDRNGEWAAGGRVDEALLAGLLTDSYFAAAPPKSTGRELFNLEWLERHLTALGRPIAARNVQTTLAELTARTIAAAVHAAAPGCARLIVCGGGAHNAHLLARLAAAGGMPVETTDAYGISPDWVEGAAFAWLAYARLHGRPGNVPTVTGARQAALLGGVYSGVSAHAHARCFGPLVGPDHSGHSESQTA
ncbi:MAG TPA: anhydro-N-acetylmuramic acid kinase [Gammaproteobacteria bacterium]|nr:anhydro-N-acetylmuramic acid kinase [Gammaproteobacteria bacterium]